MLFRAIDGLRGWLAWAVVASHTVLFCNLEVDSRLGTAISNLGYPAVLVFVIISGFVICGRIIEVKEPWRRYITRRFFRIFPLYWFLLVLAAPLLPFAADAYGMMPWGNDPQGDVQIQFADKLAATENHPVAQWLLHIGLFQGVIPDSLWPATSTNMLDPSWSLSLEWQYYLVAPIFVWLLSSKRFAALTVICVMALAVLFLGPLQKAYIQPSFLPEAAYVFMIGIASRLGFARLQNVSLPSVIVIGLLFFGLIFRDLRWLAVWGAVFVYLLNETRWNDDTVGRLMKMALESKLAIYFGARSYSTYLVHVPIMYVLLIVLAPLGLSKGVAITVFAISSVGLTAIASHVLYRCIEQPFIRLGSRVARQKSAVPAE